MGNTPLKNETDLEREAINEDFLNDADTGVELLQSSLESRSSCESSLPDISTTTLDDAISVTTDSTASITEYESANENETTGTRLLSRAENRIEEMNCEQTSLTNENDQQQEQVSRHPVFVTFDDGRQSTTSPSRMEITNTAIRQMWQNVEELARESEQFLLLARKNGIKETKKKVSKLPPVVVYEDVFVETYEDSFDVLSQALNRVTEMLTVASPARISEERDYTASEELLQSWWTKWLNERAMFVEFFEFGSGEDVRDLWQYVGDGRRSEELEFNGIDVGIMNCNENVSEAGPATAADFETISTIPFLNDSSALDYISKVGGTGLVAENLRKESLYLKFDPLVSGEMNNTAENGDLSSRFEKTLNITQDETIMNSTCNSDGKNNSSEAVIESNGGIGKLISVTPNKSPRKKKVVKHEMPPTEVAEESNRPVVTPRSSPRYSNMDIDDTSELKSLLLKQMKKEDAFKEEIEALKRDYELAVQKLQSVEKEMNQLKIVVQTSRENEEKLNNELKERTKTEQQLNNMICKYENTMSQLVTKREQEQKEYEANVRRIEADRDSTVQHLNNLENAFNDIHQKYERGKAVNEALRKNEEMLKKNLSECEANVKVIENKYELMKSHATSQLEKANQELELITQSYEKEQAKLKAMLRKSEIQINSLQNAIDRKTKENEELTAICDELIVKLSTHSNS